MMKAAVYKKYGPPEVLKINEIPKPFPGPEEILVKVYATTVAYGDVSVRKKLPLREFNMPFLLWIIARLTIGLKKPKKQIPGSEFAGVVEAIGKNVKRFRIGDPVFGYTGPNFGASAEFLCISEKTKPATFAANTLVEIKPENLTYEQSAAIPYGSITAFNLLKKANLSKDKKILINGASGNIGSAAVRIAKYYYGAQVTGVCNTDGQEFVKFIGADKVIDYSREDFTKNGEQYDVIFDILGKSSFSDCKNSLNENGRFLLAGFKEKQLIQMLWTSFFSNKKVICALSLEKPEDLTNIKKLVEDGKLKPVIDKRFPLERITEAHIYYENTDKKGSVIINIHVEK